MAAKQLKNQLDVADLRLKRIETRVKLVAILSTLVAILTGLLSALATYRQYRESVEKSRVSFTYRLTPILLPNETFYIKARIKNLSSKEITLLGVAVRVWPGDKWVDDRTVTSNPEDLIIADNRVRDCPKDFCPADMSQGRLRRRQLDDITVESTEGEYELALGPCPIDRNALAKGIWIQGRAYTVETDHGDCAIHKGTMPKPGAFPFICEARLNSTPDCYETARCSDAEAPAAFYEFHAKDNTFRLR